MLHPGLPFVPVPTRDELLGAWLLRVAQTYGLGLREFLTRIGAGPLPGTRSPHWFTLNRSSLNFDALAAALRISHAELTAMAPGACHARLPQELGFCLPCLEKAVAARQPVTWNRRWIHPLYVACEIHGVWLTPISYHALTRIRHAAEFGALPSRVRSVAGPHRQQSTDVEEATWLQRLCCAWTDVQLPWGSTAPYELRDIVESIAVTMISHAAPLNGDLHAPHGDLHLSSFKGFALHGAGGQSLQVNLAIRLCHRQWILGAVAHVLRRAPCERSWGRTWPASMTQRLVSDARRTHWSAAAIEWICPQAAEILRQEQSRQARWNCHLRVGQQDSRPALLNLPNFGPSGRARSSH